MRGDWVTSSGRENLSLAERASLLKQELTSFMQTSTAANAVFALSTLMQRMRALINAIQNGTPVLPRSLGKVECLAQAWKRGGLEEYNRILNLQNDEMGISGDI